MARALRRIKEAVVVITGASSGIGRATALAFARRGASVVVAARRTPVAGHAMTLVVLPRLRCSRRS